MKNRLPMAWIVLALTFLMQMAYSGGHFSFGVFLKPLSEQFQWSRGATAFAYTLLWWVSGFAAIYLGWLSDRIGTRKVLVFSGLVFGLGIFLSGRIQSLWEFYLYFGVLGGIGRAAARAPLLSAVFQFFNRRRGLAVGIALSGTGVGTLLFPSLARYLISAADWRAAFLVMGLLIWLILVPAALIIRKPKPGEVEPAGKPTAQNPIDTDARGILGSAQEEWTMAAALRNRVFWIFIITGLACCVSHSLPLAHIVAYASDRGIPDLKAASVLGVIGISAAIGRLLWGVVSDRIGPRKTVLCCIILQTMMMFVVAFAESLGAFYVFAVGFGLAYGGVLPQYAVVTRELFGLNRFGTVYGMHSFATSLGMGSGGIVGGYIFDLSGSYFLAFMVSTALGLMAIGFAAHLAFLKGPRAPLKETTSPVQVAAVGADV
ncbi:MAG: MFS transporter [Candidatus Tectomicrobia bacterium]|uniref:MFS transporter n=1 Tax=Tectimicrobiota bacterium TaxID=2528274 RepID=A0A932GQF8_UNCTE|nr:MFS transporter [Candidatus Tectomicrobia bacterium]